MMKYFVGFLVLFCAVAISAVAGFFSIVGMMALFSGSALSISLMMLSLEFSKLVAAGWLHHNWRNPKVSRPHKGYLVSAIIILMLITAMGCYGHLSKANIGDQAPATGVAIQLQTKQSRVDQLNADKSRLQARVGVMDASVASFLKNDKASAGMHAQAAQSEERKAIQTKIDADDAELTKLTGEMAPLKVEASGVEAKLGPLKSITQLFGWKDSEAAVRLLILMLMFAFDPLAVVLMISATITLVEAAEDKRLRVEKKEEKILDEELHEYEIITEAMADAIRDDVEPVEEPIVEEAIVEGAIVEGAIVEDTMEDQPDEETPTFDPAAHLNTIPRVAHRRHNRPVPIYSRSPLETAAPPLFNIPSQRLNTQPDRNPIYEILKSGSSEIEDTVDEETSNEETSNEETSNEETSNDTAMSQEDLHKTLIQLLESEPTLVTQLIAAADELREEKKARDAAYEASLPPPGPNRPVSPSPDGSVSWMD